MYNANELRIIQSLQKDIEGELNRVGLLYRFFSRTKSEDSILKKYKKEPGKYSEEGRKIQDLFGVRVILYFPDDLFIAQKAFEKLFRVESKTVDETTENHFSAIRCNYVYNLPEHLSRDSSLLKKYPYIDKTFEVQFRTILSEGWHEVEHDLRYKCKEDWVEHNDLSRALNGIYASLETSDWGIMKLFEELAYRNYKSSAWSGMLRNKLRLRLYGEIDDKIVDIINSEDLGKKFYRIDREELLSLMLNYNIDIPISFNNMIYLCNRFFIKSAGLDNIASPLIKKKLEDACERFNYN
ncbi:RelA/SpoT family protein [Pectobacterium versatile]|uniref:RelA/SpoT domain-containing protein n=1 Tax=Pectobacterium versatile TaxID=2488639 RepID=UPI001B3975ED|nr:RelA/SpoT domain-containing protein [Pectobacterium versatile]MBQ4768277.1 RelA/SpoT family protein [Pectobacterium versatile]